MKRVDDDRQGKAGYFDDGRAGAVGCGPELRGRIGCPNTVGKVVAVLLALVVLGASPAHAADAVDDAYTVEPGGSLSVPAPGVLENDCCPSRDSLTASLETPAAHGEVTVNPDGSFTYQHDGQGSTSDSFQYRATDSSDPAVATVFLTVGSASAPEATGDSYSVAEGGSLTVDPPGVLGNDYDPEGDPLTAVLVSPPGLAASFVLNADGSFTYVHDPTIGESGSTDAFTYSATDGGSTSPEATVSIEILTGSGTTPSIVLTLGFDQVTGAELSSQIGTTPGFEGQILKREELVIVAAEVPAVGSGPGIPPQTMELRLRVLDQTFAAAAREQFSSCHKAALIAQARPDVYRFEVVAEVPDGAVDQASGEAVVVDLADGILTCSIHRTP